MIMERLDRLENALEGKDRHQSLVPLTRGGRMGASLYVYSIDLYERLKRARAVVEDPRLRRDPISKAAVDALAYLGTAGVSAITRHVREVRGTASRTTVRNRLCKLVEYGIVVKEGTRYRLVEE